MKTYKYKLILLIDEQSKAFAALSSSFTLYNDSSAKVAFTRKSTCKNGFNKPFSIAVFALNRILTPESYEAANIQICGQMHLFWSLMLQSSKIGTFICKSVCPADRRAWRRQKAAASRNYTSTATESKAIFQF
jgi:hypothetical protein